MTPETRLKKCPFCGGRNLERQWTEAAYMIACNKCDFEMFKSSKSEAIQAWNTRHQELEGE
jgi:Lar family restriction alleviation protein